MKENKTYIIIVSKGFGEYTEVYTATNIEEAYNEVKEQLNTGTIDIYKYQKLYREGTIKNPMSHLFIICDEFAEFITIMGERMASGCT